MLLAPSDRLHRLEPHTTPVRHDKSARSSLVEAIRQRQQCNPAAYNYIVTQLKKRDERFRDWLAALNSSVSQLNRDCADLVLAALYTYDWHDEQTNELFVQFLVNLNSANSMYLQHSLTKLVQQLPSCVRQGDAHLQRIIAHACDSMHIGIRSLLAIIPSGAAALLPILADNFPHKKREASALAAYTEALLRIVEYCPVLLERVIHLIIERMIQIDAEIILDEGDEDGPFRMDDDGAQAPSSSSRVADMADMAGKLDNMMELLFQYIITRDANAQLQLFQVLHRAFDTSISLTHKCKYTQFLLFFMCSRRQDFCDAFLSGLLEFSLDSRRPQPQRLSRVAYLGSFLARARFLNIERLRVSIHVMSTWLHRYSTAHTSAAPDLDAHLFFYQLAQLLFYVVTLQQQRLFSSEEGRDWFRSLGFEGILFSSLNPLRMCYGAIVLEFSRVMQTRELLDCDSILTRNRRMLVVNRATLWDVEPFFPFDPYLLKISSRHIQPIYHDWRGIGVGGLQGATADEDDTDAGAPSRATSSPQSSRLGSLSNTPATSIPVPLPGVLTGAGSGSLAQSLSELGTTPDNYS